MTAPKLTGTGANFVTGTGSGFVTQRGDDRIPTCVEIGWGWDVTLPGRGAGQWSDVTQYARALTTQRGRSQELQRFESGTLTVTLDNRDGRFNPWNTAGAYGAGNVRIGCPIRVRISAEKSDPTGSSPAVAQFDKTDGGFYYVWWGFVTSIEPDWSDGGVGDSWCTVQAADLFALLNRSDLVNQTFPADINTTQAGSLTSATGVLGTAADRVVGVLDSVGIKTLGAGSYVFRETWTNFGDPAPFTPFVDAGGAFLVSANSLEHLQNIADGCFIDLYATPWNQLAWRPYGEIRNTAFDGTTIFGDNTPTEIPYTDIGPLYDDENLYNDVTEIYGTAAFGTSTSNSTDATSIAAYGRRHFEITIPTDGSGNLGTPSTDDFITRYKDPIVHIPSVTVSLRSMTDAQRMRVLSLPIGYRVQVKRRPATGDVLTAECFFEGAQFTWDAGMIDVKAVLNLAPVRPVNAYVDPIPH